MAVLYQSKGSGVHADARFDIDRAATPATSHKSSNFFNKHIRIVDALPSDTEMANTVQQIWDDRMKSPASKVTNAMGEQRKKSDVYGKIKPPANTTLFVTPGGFESMNAYIEQFVTKSGKAWIPIPGGGKVVSRKKDASGGANQTEIFDAGYWEIEVDVGGSVAMGRGPSGPMSYNSKVVFHFGDVSKSLPGH